MSPKYKVGDEIIYKTYAYNREGHYVINGRFYVIVAVAVVDGLVYSLKKINNNPNNKIIKRFIVDVDAVAIPLTEVSKLLYV